VEVEVGWGGGREEVGWGSVTSIYSEAILFANREQRH
jgi:hypothetical protein